MNIWLDAATVLLLGLLLLALALRGSALDGIAALQLGGTVVSVDLLLLAEGFHRSSYLVLPVVAAILSFVGTLVYLRLLRHLE